VQLTSGSFLLVMIGAAVGWIVMTAAVWPRLAGRAVSRHGSRAAGRLAARLAGRVGLLVTSQVLVLAAFLVWLNGYFSFIGSWSELFGTAANARTSRQADLYPLTDPAAALAGRQSRALPDPVLFDGFGLGPGPGQPGRPPHDSGHLVRRLERLPGAAHYGMLARVQVRGLRSGLSEDSGYVYLPPQYFQRAHARERFPAVLSLTGYPGEAKAMIDRLGLPATAARLTAAGRARPAVYVMLNVSPVFPRDTECTNVPAGPQVATYFAVDVPLAIEQTFRVSTSAANWGTLGYSTGGACAAKLTMLYPDTFSAAVSMAGYYFALHDSTTGDLYGRSPGYKEDNDLDWRLTHLPAPPVSVLVTTSRVGESTYPGTLKFLRLIRPPMHGYSYILPVGGHNFGVWYQELPQALRWLTSRLGYPNPDSGSQPGPTPRPIGSTA
jgi:enterochelin esterase-like enzyme